MSDTIISALISGAVTMAGSVIAVVASSRETDKNLRTSQAVTDEKITELTREVREHNNFARRMPVVEEQIKVINHRIKDLEEKQ